MGFADDPRGALQHGKRACLHGPNDGEPINSRTLELSLATDCDRRSTLSLTVNGTFLYSRPLIQGAFYERGGLFYTDVLIDLEQAQRATGYSLFRPDSGPLTISAYLYSPASQLLATAVWTHHLGRPWVEVESRGADGPGGRNRPNSGAVTLSAERRLVLHPARKDLVYLLISSSNRELLSASPHEPRLLEQGVLIASGNATSVPEAGLATSLSWFLNSPLRQAYVVLWALDSDGAWHRSDITLITR